MVKKKSSYPLKTTLNLVIIERSNNYHQKLLIGFLIGIIVIGVFTKFAVVDVLSHARELDQKAKSERARYEQLIRDNAIYSDVRAEYEKHFTMIEDIEGMADCLDVLGLIDNSFMPRASVQSAAFTEKGLSVILTGINLEQASGIVKDLYTSDLVSSVSVSSADTTIEGVESSVAMNITLVSVGGNAK